MHANTGAQAATANTMKASVMNAQKVMTANAMHAMITNAEAQAVQGAMNAIKATSRKDIHAHAMTSNAMHVMQNTMRITRGRIHTDHLE